MHFVMKGFCLISCLFCLLVTPLRAQPPQADTSVVLPSGVEERFKLVLEDRFEGPELDNKKWKATKGVPRDPEMVNSIHYYKPENVEVSDGSLKLWVRRDTMPNKEYKTWIDVAMVSFTYDFEFSSAEIESAEKYGYGMYEIRCKLPRGKGYWPAFWMYGEPQGRNNELDVFEFWNEGAFLRRFVPRRLSSVQHMTAHFDGGMSKGSQRGVDASEGFHTYTLIWDDCKILWFFDGELRRSLYQYKGVRDRDPDCSRAASRRNPKMNVFPIDEGLRILAGVAVQSGKDAPDVDTEFPQAMEVDYIRFYERVD